MAKGFELLYNTPMRNKFNMIKNAKSAYLIGIGGVGMSAIAVFLKESGLWVSGNDLVESSYVKKLKSSGIDICIGDCGGIPSDVDMVVCSTAVSASNKQYADAVRKGIPVFHRSEILGYFSSLHKNTVGVIGMHGKTTTSALAAYLLNESFVKTSFAVGGTLKNYGTNALFAADMENFVFELDESDKSMKNVPLRKLVITNIEEEHLDCYEDIGDIRNTFASFISENVSETLIYNSDDGNTSDIVRMSGFAGKSLSYSLKEKKADICLDKICSDGSATYFRLYLRGVYKGDFAVNLLGEYNLYNTAAALAVLYDMGIDYSCIKGALNGFLGVKRRMDIFYEDGRYVFIHDYAHHPTELEAVINTVRAKYGEDTELLLVFQPHRYSRVKKLWNRFIDVLSLPDRVVLTNIFPASENKEDYGIDDDLFFDSLLARRAEHTYFAGEDNCSDIVFKSLPDSGVILFCGAGTILNYGNKFKEKFFRLPVA